MPLSIDDILKQGDALALPPDALAKPPAALALYLRHGDSFRPLASKKLLCSKAIAPLPSNRHRTQELLYIGKAKNLRDRLRGGHKVFLWGWLDRYDPNDVRIAYVIINEWQRPGLSYELETLILQASNPPYNVKIPRAL
ncbi:GIY-YIG nuclease family protein [Nodosilinea sp. LEGE 07088]|nr:GIY-YIG nuclease family protein [Nodosilinea sp. LEGE 07088]